MTNFKKKIRSVHNKNILVNLAPKLKWYHFHRVSNLELKFRIKVKNFTKFLQLMADFQCAKGCVILLHCNQNTQVFSRGKAKSVQNCTKNWLSFLILLKVYESGTMLILVPNWQGYFCYGLIESFPWNSSTKVSLIFVLIVFWEFVKVSSSNVIFLGNLKR